MINLGELVNIKGGGTPSRDRAEYWNGNIPWASVKDITSLSLNKTLETITELGLKNSATNLYPAGTIIIPTRMALGKVTISSIDLAINQDLKALVINDTQKLTKEYLKYFLIAKSKEIELSGKGATVKGITVDVIKNLKINLPDLPTQTKIAQILDTADQIRQKRKKAIELADEFLRSLFLEMFGDPVVNPKGWEIEELKNFTEFENGDRSSNYPSGKDLLPSGIPFLSTKNINSDTYSEVTLNYISEDKFNSLSRGKVNNGDILITLRGTLASCCIFNSKYEQAFINAQMMIIRTNKTKISNDFLHSLLTFSTVNYKLKNLGQGAAVPQLTAKQLQEFKVIIPPLEKQNTFLNIKRKISDLKNKIESSKTDELFNSLSQQYFAKVE